MTTPEQNMATCREFNERVFNEGDISFAEKMMRDDFIDHSPPPGVTGDKASTIAMFQQMHDQVRFLDSARRGNSPPATRSLSARA